MEKISFVILSYNRPTETIEAMQNILFDLQDLEGFQKEIVVVNNGSTVSYSPVTEFIQTQELVKYIDHPVNLGVSGGRNLGIKNATGKYLIFLDDDAIFKEKDILDTVHSHFSKDQTLGIIAFALYNFYTNESDHPVKKKKKLKEDEFYNNIFWGGACVIHRKVFEEAGVLDEQFFYGMEEYDLAYRMLDKKYKILFTKKVSVLHKVSPAGRERNDVKYLRMFANKCLIAYRYLPWFYVVSHILAWSAYLLFKTRMNLAVFFKAYKTLYLKIQNTQRTPIAKETLQYIKSVSGRLVY